MLGQELEELPSRRINSQAFQDCKAFFYGFVMRIKLSPSLFIPQTVINSGPCWQNSGLCITARLNRLCLIQCSIICVHAHAATNKLNTFKQVDILPPTSEANKITHVLLGLMVHSGTEASLLPWPISPLDKDQVEKPSYRKWPYTNCHLLILETRTLPLTTWHCAHSGSSSDSSLRRWKYLSGWIVKHVWTSHSVNFGCVNKLAINVL